MSAAVAMTLKQLLDGIAPAPSLAVSDLSLDGRQAAPGGAFVALRGTRRHGLEFLAQALERGACAVLWDPAEGGPPALPAGIAGVPVAGLRERLGQIADRYYREPSASLSIAGVTGTNGKTTCAWLLATALGRLDRAGAYLGTLGAGVPPDLEAGELTTPDVVALHRRLRRLADDGAARVAMEVSSHALDQGRLDGLRLRIAAFTNLTRDHLDYHGTMERYEGAKARLFQLPGLAHAVINTGDAAGRRFAGMIAPPVALTEICSGGEAPRHQRFIQVERRTATPAGLTLALRGHFGRREMRSPLVGDFNAENLAVVLGVLLAWDVGVDAALEALAHCGPPPGRMERFGLASGAVALVDYAHTPDALSKVLTAARAHAAGSLSVVFGCGGDRDPGKRAAMGAVAEQLADRVWVTDDNPRDEDPDGIVRMVLSGMDAPGRASVERDRAAAIRAALAAAGSGDVVVIAGKGHEDYQLAAGVRRPFSDRDCVRRCAGVAT